jgi:hypothetical protein
VRPNFHKVPPTSSPQTSDQENKESSKNCSNLNSGTLKFDVRFDNGGTGDEFIGNIDWSDPDLHP